MTKLIATIIAAVAFAVTVPVAVAQTTSKSDTSLPGAAPRIYETGPGVMTGPGQTQSGKGSGMVDGHGMGWMSAYVLFLLGGVGGFFVWVVGLKGK